MCLIACAAPVFAAVPPAPPQLPLGVAWQVRGQWHLPGRNSPLLSGDAVPPGALLQPGEEAGSHSILIFLPDGQRIFYECFAAADCARGFRVPPLYRSPEPFAVGMMARIHAVLAGNHGAPAPPAGVQPRPRDEAVVSLSADHQVQIAGLAAALPNGHYSYDLRPLDAALPAESRRPLEKTGSSIALTLPAAGLYEIRITDARNAPRIDLYIAAVDPAASARIEKDFKRAHSLLGDWNIDYQGWPIQEFEWAYLQSVVEHIRPLHDAAPATFKLAGDSEHHAPLSAEPVFTPRPAAFKGDTAVTLRCATPGATIHFTMDNSQPMANSPVYGAPIMVKGTELTVKAYATAPGRKDSPVVTGIFRIDEDQ
jgi:hypothetical protein